MLSQSTLGKTLAPGRSQAPQPTCHRSSPLGPADAASRQEGGREGGAAAHKCSVSNLLRAVADEDLHRAEPDRPDRPDAEQVPAVRRVGVARRVLVVAGLQVALGRVGAEACAARGHPLGSGAERAAVDNRQVLNDLDHLPGQWSTDEVQIGEGKQEMGECVAAV